MNKKKIIIISVVVVALVTIIIIIGANSNIDLISLKGDISSLNGLSIECEKTKLSVDESTTCVLLFDSSLYNITSFQGELSSSPNIRISNIKKNSIFKYGYDNDKELFYISDEPLSGKIQIAMFEIEGIKKGTGTIRIDKNKNNLLTITDLDDNKNINLKSKNIMIQID